MSNKTDNNLKEISTYHSIDPDSIKLKKPRNTKTGSKYFDFIQNNEIFLQTPRCFNMFKPEFSLCLCVKEEFGNFLRKIDNKILTLVEPHFEDINQIRYMPLVRTYGEGQDVLEYIRINIGQKTKFFDKNKKHLDRMAALTSLKICDEVKCILKFKQVQYKKSKSIGGFCLALQIELVQVQLIRDRDSVEEDSAN